jgi:type II secretory pathway pseudopilin PulG
MRPFGAAFSEVAMVQTAGELRAAERQWGHTLPEGLVAMAVMAMLLLISVPQLAELQGAAELNSLTGRLRAMMYRCRAYAIVRGRSVSLVFEQASDGGWQCFVAEDGDGDGVLRSDLRSGRDRILERLLQLEGRHAGLGILRDSDIPDPSGRGVLEGNPNDPVRAGRGDIISFTPSSTATPSSVYLTDHRARMRVLRVYGGTARVNSLVWRRGWSGWRKTGL